MQIKRLLNDIEVVAGDKLINTQGDATHRILFLMNGIH
jgi:hypothetical protein